MSIGPLDIVQRNAFGGGSLPTVPPTDEIGSTSIYTVNVPGWYSYVSDSLERSPELQWPRSIQTYADMRHDAQVQGLFLATSLPIRRYHWLLDPNGCDLDMVTTLAQDLSIDIKNHEPLPKQKYRQRFNMGKHLQDALVALVMGHYAFEQVGEVGDDGLWHLTKLAPRPPETITEISIDSVGELVGFKQFSSSQLIPANRVTWYAWMMEGANWTGRSLLRACYRNWLRKDRLLRVDAQKQERNGIGIPIAEAPPGMSGAAMLRLDMLMRKMRAGDTSGGAVPNGTKVSLVGTTGTLPDTIGSVRLDNEEMARAWLAMFMQLGQTQSGSRALGTEFIDFFSDSLDEMANWLCATFTESVIENWWGWNVDPEADATPQLVYTRNPDSAFTGREFAMLLERGAIVMDDELENAIRERYGLPMRTPGLPRPVVPEPTSTIPWPPGAPVDGPISQPSTSPAGQGPMSDEPVYGRKGDGRSVRARPLSPVTLPDRPLSRELYPHEVLAAVDWGSADANWQQQRDLLVNAVRQPQLQQMDELHDQLVDAGNDLTKIGQIQAKPALENVIFSHMSTMATMGAHDAQMEASRQGYTVQLPDLTELSDAQRPRAQVVDQFLADTLTNSAKSSALIYAGGAMTAKEIADKVKSDLINLSTSFVSDQLGGALTAAMNAGRKATIGLAMAKAGQIVHASKGKRIMAQAGSPQVTVYASEVLDDNTCDPCEAIDGTQYVSMDDAESDYPSGGYSDCDGWSRCRGTLVAVYDEAPVAEPPSITEPSAYPSALPDSETPTTPAFGKGTQWTDSQDQIVNKAISDAVDRHPEMLQGKTAFKGTFYTSSKPTDVANELDIGRNKASKLQTYTYGSNAATGDPFSWLEKLPNAICINDSVPFTAARMAGSAVRTEEGLITHELGHSYFFSQGVNSDIARDLLIKNDLFADEIRNTISLYGGSEPNEALAELYAKKFASEEGLPSDVDAKFSRLMDQVRMGELPDGYEYDQYAWDHPEWYGPDHKAYLPPEARQPVSEVDPSLSRPKGTYYDPDYGWVDQDGKPVDISWGEHKKIIKENPPIVNQPIAPKVSNTAGLNGANALPEVLPMSDIPETLDNIGVTVSNSYDEQKVRTTLARNFENIDDRVSSRLQEVTTNWKPIPESPNAHAYYQKLDLSGKTAKTVERITMKPEFYESPSTMNDALQRGLKSGWMSPDGLAPTGADRTLTHELGHFLDRQLSRADSLELRDALHTDFDLKPGTTKTASEVSRYGATNDNEMIAELWAEFKTSPEPRDAAMYVGSFFEDKLGAYYTP